MIFDKRIVTQLIDMQGANEKVNGNKEFVIEWRE